jgi:CBS domain-containing protein
MKLSRVLELKGNPDKDTISWEAYVADFIRLAVKKNVGAIPVVDNTGKIVGIISERDILRHCERGTDFKQTHIVSVMTRDLITAQVDDDINKAMDLMIKGRMRNLPVLNGEAYEGMITVRDLIYALRKADELEMQKLVDYIKTELDSRATSHGD